MTGPEKDAEWLKAEAEDHQDRVDQLMQEEWSHRWAETHTTPWPDDLSDDLEDIGLCLPCPPRRPGPQP